ncbi:RNA polymerase sigma factor [Actinomadura fibrosa]|uniref:RNA polymerase sigma factor n=1 Tax=Actinomadura fibrosa TaxID=111802 RepID=A0ABW2XI65_9ACTN|nr:sigma factor-like helix-turn-helix DNA-binding protein [Actinomadura fibrosa]
MLALVAWEGLSNAEIATVLGCSLSAVSIRLHRARRALCPRPASRRHRRPVRRARPYGPLPGSRFEE